LFLTVFIAFFTFSVYFFVFMRWIKLVFAIYSAPIQIASFIVSYRIQCRIKVGSIDAAALS